MTHGTRIDSPERQVLREQYRSKPLPKHLWGDGPWQQEPDRIEWYDEATGYPCLMRRNMIASGTWCGYVAVPPGHPAHGKHFDEAPVDGLRVHGGVTHTGMCEGDICHVPRPGEPDDVFWVGFDAAHWNDYMPSTEARCRLREDPRDDTLQKLNNMIANSERRLGFCGEVYRDVGYIKSECRNLAAQLKALAR